MSPFCPPRRLEHSAPCLGPPRFLSILTFSHLARVTGWLMIYHLRARPLAPARELFGRARGATCLTRGSTVSSPGALRPTSRPIRREVPSARGAPQASLSGQPEGAASSWTRPLRRADPSLACLRRQLLVCARPQCASCSAWQRSLRLLTPTQLKRARLLIGRRARFAFARADRTHGHRQASGAGQRSCGSRRGR